MRRDAADSAAIEVIAEAANGQEGEEARQQALIRLAAAAGADAIKFQLVYADEVFTRDHENYARFHNYEMPDEAWERAARLAADLKCRFYTDVLGLRGVTVAGAIGADGIKLHPADTANIALMKAVAACPVRRVVLGVGGSTRREIARAVGILKGKELVLMHGFQGYPTPTEDSQLARLRELRDAYPDAELGFTDHVPYDDPATGTWFAAVAIGFGVTVIEKHITVAAVEQRTDYDAALAPDDFARFTANLRLAARAVAAPDRATADFGMSAAEQRYRSWSRKAVVAGRDLEAGHVVAPEDLAFKRTSDSRAVFDPALVLGRRLASGVTADAALHDGVLE